MRSGSSPFGNSPLIPYFHHRRMSGDSVASLENSALSARERISAYAAQAAGDQRGAARFARAALFQEALLGALRARFAELRTVAK